MITSRKNNHSTVALLSRQALIAAIRKRSLGGGELPFVDGCFRPLAKTGQIECDCAIPCV